MLRDIFAPFLTKRLFALSTLALVSSTMVTAEENTNADTDDRAWLRARVAELEKVVAASKSQDIREQGEDLSEQDEATRVALLDLLNKTGLDPKEHPEISRALGEGSNLGVAEQIERRREIMASIPSIMPVKNGEGYLSSQFGERNYSFSSKKQFHKGLDIAGPEGTPIYAPADGIIRYAAKYGRFGNYISIVHGYGLVTKFAHASQIFVAAGQFVRKGDKIAAMGSTGRVTGTHLHYEVWLNDHVVDPARFMLDRPTSLVAQTKSSDTEATP